MTGPLASAHADLARAVRYVLPPDEARRLEVVHYDDFGRPALAFFDAATGDKVIEVRGMELFGLDGGAAFGRLIRERLSGWRERLYDYNPIADGLWEGDTL